MIRPPTPIFLTLLSKWDYSHYVVYITRFKPSKAKNFKEMHTLKLLVEPVEIIPILKLYGMEGRKLCRTINVSQLFKDINTHLEATKIVWHTKQILLDGPKSTREIKAYLNKKGLKVTVQEIGAALKKCVDIQKKQVRIDKKLKRIWEAKNGNDERPDNK